MFARKRNTVIKALHYEGIDSFPIDYPCTLEIVNDELIIKRIKPETTVTLPLSRVKSFSAMKEQNFMLKYHGQAISTSREKGINKYYLVVEYDKGILAFWGTSKEYGKFLDLQHLPLINQSSHINL